MPERSVPRIAVIGGGLTGLSAVHRLMELSHERGQPLDLHLFEAGPKAGGLIGTVERDGYLIDTGADSFITNKPAGLALCRRLGLESRLQATDAKYRGAHVLRKGKPYRVPDGFQLMSPSALWPVMMSPILSWPGKLRLAAEMFVPKRKVAGDESLASFVRRRFGAEALERLVQPLVGGIYTSDPEKLSLAATLPRFLEQEQQWGSLIRAARAAKAAATGDDRVSGGARYGLFAGFRGGMAELSQALIKSISPACQIHIGQKIQHISRSPEVFPARPPGYVLTFADEKSQVFDAVILTPAAYQVAELVSGLDSILSAKLQAIEYASSAIVVTGHALANVAHPLDSFGLVIPHRERRQILAVSFSSRKFPNRAPEGRVLLRTFVGGALQPELFDLDDSAMIGLVRKELQATLGVRGEPDFAMVVRYPRAMPQYHLGHLDRVAEIERLVAGHARLAIAGNAYHGVGVPDSIQSGEQAAERIIGCGL